MPDNKTKDPDKKLGRPKKSTVPADTVGEIVDEKLTERLDMDQKEKAGSSPAFFHPPYKAAQQPQFFLGQRRQEEFDLCQRLFPCLFLMFDITPPPLWASAPTVGRLRLIFFV